MTNQPWTVKAWLGAYSWTVHDNDNGAGTFGPGVPILAGPFTTSRGVPNADLAPLCQPTAETASIQVIAATVTDLDLLQIGDAVTLRYFGATAPGVGDAPIVEFTGRVSTLEAQPHKLGVLFTVGCVDYTADLGEGIVGTAAYPSETIDSRIRRVLIEAGLNSPAGVALYGGTATIPLPSTLAARAASPATPLELMSRLVAQYRMEFTGFPNSVGVAYFYPVTTPPRGLSNYSSGAAVLDNTNGPYNIGTIFRSPPFSAPLRVTLVAGVYKLTGSAANTAVGGVTVAEAARVDMSTRFAQRKGDAINSIKATSDSWGTVGVSWAPPPATVVATVETDLTTVADGSALAIVYLPPLRPTGNILWVCDGMTWEVDAEPGSFRPPDVGRGFLVANMLGKWSPLEREWYTGVCSGWTFTVDDGIPKLDVGVMPWNVDGSKAIQPFKWSDAVAGMTWANMSTRDTYQDYALAGI